MSQSRKKYSLEQDIRHQKYFFNKSWDILIPDLLKNPNRLFEAETLCQRAQNLGHQSADLFDLEVHLLEYYIYEKRDKDGYIRLVKNLTAMTENINLKLDRLSLGLFYVDKFYAGTIYDTCAESYSKVFIDLQTAIDIFHTFGYDKEHFRALSYMAKCHIYKGCLSKALECLAQAETVFLSVKSPSFRRIFMYVKVWALYEKGDFDTSLNVTEKAILLSDQDNLAVINFCLLNLKAINLLRLHKPSEALALATETYQAELEYFKTTKVDMIAETLLILAEVYQAKGDLEPSKKLFLESLDIMNEFFDGEDNICDQAPIHVGLGKIYQIQGENEKAIEAYHTALKIYEKVYICQESDAISSLYTHLAFFQSHLHHKFQARQYFKKHQENFGNQHFRTLDMAKFFEKMKIPL